MRIKVKPKFWQLWSGTEYAISEILKSPGAQVLILSESRSHWLKTSFPGVALVWQLITAMTRSRGHSGEVFGLFANAQTTPEVNWQVRARVK